MPNGWQRVTLGDIAQINPENTKGFPPSRVIRYVDLSSVAADTGIATDRLVENEYSRAPGRARRVIRSDDVLVATVRPYLRGFSLVPKALDGEVASTGFAVLRAKRDIAIPRFIWATVQSDEFVAALIAKSTGTNYPAVRPADIASYDVILPPLVEQHRIADLVDSIDLALKAARRLRAVSLNVCASMADALIFGGDGGSTSTVRDLAVERGLVGGPFGSSLGRKDYASEGVPVIRGQNMSGASRYVGGEFVYVSAEKATELHRNQAQPGDVIFTQRGTLGQVALVPEEPHDRYVISQSQMRLRTNSAVVLPEYVFHVFRTQRIVNEVVGRNTATANPHINLGILASIAIPMPTVDEQRRTVRILDQASVVVEACIHEEEALRRVHSALLEDLLSGSHRVPDSYDELLEGTR